MALRVNNNIQAINAQRAIGRHLGSVNRRLERLSSGLRVNRAADDASGLVVSEGLRSILSGLGQNLRNAQEATDLLQTAEGSLQEVNDVLIRLRELALQSASSTLNDDNRESAAAEFGQLVSEIDRIAQSTTFNTQTLLAGFGQRVGDSSTALTASPSTGVAQVSLSGALPGTFTFVDHPGDSTLTLGDGRTTQTIDLGTLLDGSSVATGTSVVANFDRLGIQLTLAGPQVESAAGHFADGALDQATLVVESGTGGVFQLGPNAGFADRLEVGLADLRASGEALALDQFSIGSRDSARQALQGLDQAISTVSGERGKLGAAQNRLSSSISFTENEIENTTAADATIRDADLARELTQFSRAQILLQSSNAVLVQANLGSLQALALF